MPGWAVRPAHGAAGRFPPAGACGPPAASRSARASRPGFWARLSRLGGWRTRPAREGQARQPGRQHEAGDEAHRNQQDGNADRPGQNPDTGGAAPGVIKEYRLVGHRLLIQCGPIPALCDRGLRARRPGVARHGVAIARSHMARHAFMLTEALQLFRREYVASYNCAKCPGYCCSYP